MRKVEQVQSNIIQLKAYYELITEAVNAGQLVEVDSDVVESLATFLYSDEIFDFLPVEKVNDLVLLFKNILDISQVVNEVKATLGNFQKRGLSYLVSVFDHKFKSILLAKEQYDHQVWLEEIFISLCLNALLENLNSIKLLRGEKNRVFWFFYDFREELLAISHGRDDLIAGIEKALDIIIKHFNKPVSWESDLIVTSINDANSGLENLLKRFVG